MLEYKSKKGMILKDGHTMFLKDVIKDLNRKAFLEEKILQLPELSEQINQLSEALVGYREGSFEELIAKARQLRELETMQELLDHKDEIIEAIDRLQGIFSDCGS